MTALHAACLLCLALPGAAMAEPWGCEFTVECITGEACAAAAYGIDIIAADHEGRMFLSGIIGDTPLVRLTERGALPASFASGARSGLAELVTIEPDRTAVMTAHAFDIEGGGAMAVTYFGTCEAL